MNKSPKTTPEKRSLLEKIPVDDIATIILVFGFLVIVIGSWVLYD